jgi:DNA-binding LacI/PurR family transcriptional regulator
VSIRIEDIARAAEVSTATVSRVLNNPSQVRPVTREKIRAIINQLGYKPNYVAQSLMKGYTDSVGLLVSYHTNPYFTTIVDAISSILIKRGIFLYLCNCENNVESEKEYTEELFRRNIDALIVLETPSLNTKDNFFIHQKFNHPVILINQHLEPYGDNYIVRCDQKPGILEIFNYIENNRLYPFILFNGSNNSYSFILKDMLFDEWKKKAHLSDREVINFPVKKIFDSNDENIVWYICEIIKELIKSGKRPRSIFAANELMALGVLAAARELSIAIPEELAVVGIDNTILARVSTPPLSTIDLHMNEIGIKAAELYLKLKNNPKEDHPRVQVIPSQLCMRHTL